tara:strand:+ start:4156 stop:4974 length:819 start_codon:yes stop_codon:yes gene_type:complete
MAKAKAKAKTKATEVVEQEIKVTKPVEMVADKPNKWEFKDRTYLLKGPQPLVRIVKSKGIYWFDEGKGHERELLLTANQRTVFVDEMEGVKRPEHIVFRDGVLIVPKNKVVLQQLLSLYHPSKDSTYYEYDPAGEAVSEVVDIEFELEAMNAAANMDIDQAEAIMRAEIGSEVSRMSSKELKRDLLLFARSNPELFLELMNDDNIHLRNIGIKATEASIISLSPDNRAFTWGNTGRKLMTVPFDEHPYSALAAWFKTDEGMEVLNSIEKRLN